MRMCVWAQDDSTGGIPDSLLQRRRFEHEQTTQNVVPFIQFSYLYDLKPGSISQRGGRGACRVLPVQHGERR